jgi:hypothetical protein
MIPNLAQEVLQVAFLKYWKKLEGLRIKDAEKIYAWYFNEKDKILGYVETGMLKMFKSKTVNKMNIRIFNVVPRIIDKLALVYKDHPERMLDGGIKEDGTQTDADKTYREILEESNIYQKEIEWERQSKAFNTVLVQPYFVENGQYVDFKIHTPALTVVEVDPDDYSRIISFCFPVYKKLKPDKDEERVMIYWSATEHFYIDSLGNKMAVVGNEGMVNPYGILPVAVLRRKLGNDFWGEGMWDLVDGNEEVCIQLSNLYYVSIFQSHGQPFGVNLHLTGADGTISEPTLGPDCPILAEGVSKDELPPSLQFVNAHPELKAVQDLIDWSIKTIQSLKGLSPQQYDLQSSIASGISKVIDATDIQEIRQDDLKVLQNFEYDLFKVMKAVNNYHNPKKISSDGFTVKFVDPEVVETQQDKNIKMQVGIANNTISVVDVIMENNPGLTRAQALEKIALNKEDNEKFAPKPIDNKNLVKEPSAMPDKNMTPDMMKNEN